MCESSFCKYINQVSICYFFSISLDEYSAKGYSHCATELFRYITQYLGEIVYQAIDFRVHAENGKRKTHTK